MNKSARKLAPAKRKRRSPEELKDRIVEAAAAEFRRAGYAKATTAAIAQRAKVTETQLFRYFGSKANLFREAIFKPLDQQILSFFESYPRAAGETATDFRGGSKLYISDLHRFLSENADMMVSLMAAQRYDQEMARDGEIESLASYFDRGAAMMRASIKGEPRIDPKLMVRISFAAVLASVIFKDWLFPKGVASEKDIRAAIDAFVLDGLGAVHDDRK